MKIIKNLVYWLFILCLPLLIISSNIRCGVNSIWLYDYNLNKYPVSKTTGIENEELRKVYQHLIYFYSSKVDSPQVLVIKGGDDFEIFNERELIHLEDVKDLMRLDYMIQIITLVICVLSAFILLFMFKEKWRLLIKGILRGSILTFAVMIALALWAVFGFDQLFLLFHLVSFSNEFWILDPTKDYLIMLFPGQFFFDAALFGFGAVLLESLIIGTAAFITLKFHK